MFLNFNKKHKKHFLHLCSNAQWALILFCDPGAKSLTHLLRPI